MKNPDTKLIYFLVAMMLVSMGVVLYLLVLLKKSPPVGTEAQRIPSPTVGSPAQGKLGVVDSIILLSDGKVEVVVDGETFLFPADQKVILVSNDREPMAVPLREINKATIVNVIKFTKSEKYSIFGTVDRTLVDKLI